MGVGEEDLQVYQVGDYVDVILEKHYVGCKDKESHYMVFKEKSERA